MTAITYALNRIKSTIPRNILNNAFMPTQMHQLRRDPFMPSNIDDVIIDQVINRRVRKDCDVAGASEIIIPINTIQPQIVSQDCYLLHVPKELTGGREITSAISLIFYGLYQTNLGTQYFGGVSAMSANLAGRCNQQLRPLTAMAASSKSLPYTETTNVRVVDGSTVVVNDILLPTPNSYLKLVVAHDREFSTLSPTAYRAFGKLCEYAAKAYIYNKLIIEIDMTELVGGHELGKIKEIVESYSDANELYDEYYDTKWRKIQFMSDEKRHTDFIKSLVGRFK